MTGICAACREPIRLTVYGWGHVRNPGPRHHYARPAHVKAPTGGGTTVGAGASVRGHYRAPARS